jgi:Zn-dependent protease with chaperone function
MHTQTASASELRAEFASRLHAAAGLGLYLLTLAGEVVLGAGVRWLLTYLGAGVLGAIVPLGPGAEQLALLAALLPLGWSLIGLALPGRGFVWARRIGARRPSVEEAGIIDDARQLLRGVDPSLPEAHAVYLLDDPLPAGAARGRSVVLSRGLLETESVAPVFAHELGHTRSLDGRLTDALDRLKLWGERPRPAHLHAGAAGQSTGEEHRGILTGLIRLILRLAGGGCAARVLAPLWSAYWRSREYAADAYAASLEQGEDLARHLADVELSFDLPRRRFPFDLAEHPPVALRIERLTATQAQTR